MFSGNYDLPGQRSDSRRLAHELGAVDLQRAGADDQLRGGDRIRNGLLRARGRRSVRRQPQREAVLQSGRALRTRVRCATIGQTDFSPLGGKRSQVTGPPLRQLDMGFAKQFKIFGQRQFEVRGEAFNVTNTPAFNLPGSLDFLDARNFASITSMRNTPRQIQLGAKIYW